MFKDFSIEQDHKDLSCIIIKGEIDIGNVESFKEQMDNYVKTGDIDIRVDCSGLTYIDSRGLSVFIYLLKKAIQQNRKIYLVNTNDNINKLMKITNLDKFFMPCC